ncbi:MAG: hypothetical protein KJ623_02540 [Nanoarchaeota archaeon]|nr:hypothetical protein [Nanoarchaeota archaeon]
MFLKARDRIKKFYSLIAETDVLVKNERYEDAIGLYNEVNKAYESIPISMRTEALSQNLDRLNRELILYLKIKEIHTLISNKNFSRIDEMLEYIKMLIFKLKEQTPKPISLIKFGEDKYRYYGEMYKVEREKDLFNKKYERIKEAIIKGDIKRATLLFEDLKLKFKDVEKYGKALDLYGKLEQIRRKIENPETIKHKGVEYYNSKKEPVKEKIIEKKEVVNEKTVDEELSEIHKLLKENDVSNAKRLFKRL